MLPWTNEQLMEAVDKRRPAPTTILDAHFSTRRPADASLIQVDIKKGPEGIAVAIDAGAKSKRAKSEGWDSIPMQIPRFSEHDIIKASDFSQFRQPGVMNAANQAAFMQKVMDKFDDMKKRFDRTKEFMAIKGMQGQIVDGDGNILVDYDVPAAGTLNTGTTSPLVFFRQQHAAIARVLGYMPSMLMCYAGETAYDKIMDHADVKALLGGPMGPTMVQDGMVQRIQNVYIKQMPLEFVNNAGSAERYVADNKIILAPKEMDARLLYAPCESPRGMISVPLYVDQWDEKDPAGTMIRLEENPLPLIRRPDACRHHTVS